MNSQYTINTSELTEGSEKTINIKSIIQPIIIALIGCMLLFTMRMGIIILGIILLTVSIAYLLLVKQKKVVDFYHDFVVVYDYSNPDYCYKIPYSEIATYYYQQINSSNIFIIETNDKYMIQVPSSNHEIMREFKKRCPGKEKMDLWKSELEQRSKARRAAAKARRANKNN